MQLKYRIKIKENCRVPACIEPSHILGLCKYHYYRNHRTGEFSQFTKTTYHRKTKTSEYIAYTNMIQRCYNENLPIYKYYGGRGITVCDRWLESFRNFVEDMGLKPHRKLTLDRVDNDGNYEPSNCRWADRTTQNQNRRSYQKR